VTAAAVGLSTSQPGAAQAQDSRDAGFMLSLSVAMSGLANPPLPLRTDREGSHGRRRRESKKEIETLSNRSGSGVDPAGPIESLLIEHNRPQALLQALAQHEAGCWGIGPSLASTINRAHRHAEDPDPLPPKSE